MKTCPHCGKTFERKKRECVSRWSARMFCSNECNTKSRAGKERSSPWLVKHGRSRDPIYKIWTAMKQRCQNQKCESWGNYGGRGIRVCDRWMNFENFLDDMGPRPPGGTLERADNNGAYEPSNCFWADRLHQQNNRRVNRLLTADGETMTCRQWELRLGFRRGTIASRKRLGWSDVEAVKTPAMYGNRPNTRATS